MKSNRILGHSSGHSAARWRDAQARPRCALCRLACSQKSAGSASASGGGDWTPLPQRDVLRQLISSARPSFLLVQSSFIPSISQSSASPRPLQLARRLPKITSLAPRRSWSQARQPATGTSGGASTQRAARLNLVLPAILHAPVRQHLPALRKSTRVANLTTSKSRDPTRLRPSTS
jgi:hypothetical protein